MKLSDCYLMEPKRVPPFSRAGWFFELKYDGHRCLSNRQQLLTSGKIDVTAKYAPVSEALAKLRGDFVFDGELCMLDEQGIPDFEAMQSKVPERTLAYFVFDVQFWRGDDLRTEPYLDRKAILRKLIPPDHPKLRYVDYLEEKGEMLYAYSQSIGMEGVVGKRGDSKYIAGKTNYWLKSTPTGYYAGFKRPMRQKKEIANKLTDP